MQPSTRTDGIRRISIRPVNASRTSAVDADTLGQSMQLMGAMMIYPRNTEFLVRMSLRTTSIGSSAAASVLTRS
jgi:hypothetical protein